MIISIFCAIIGILQFPQISCVVETIHCPQDLNNAQYNVDTNSALLLVNANLTLYLQDDFKLYTRDTSTVDIIVHDVLAVVSGDMHWLNLSTQRTSPLNHKYAEYNYEIRGLAKRVLLTAKYSELDAVRVVTVPLYKDDLFNMPKSLRYRFQKEVEACLERQIHFGLNKLQKHHFLQPLSNSGGCSVSELPYVVSSTPFQDVINKAADVVIRKIIEEFVNPVEGQIEAPMLSIKFRKFIFVSGTFDIANGTLRDLRTIKRRSDVTVSRNGQFVTLSASFYVKNVSVIYHDYAISGTIPLTGHNITINFKDGVILDAIVDIDTNEFPCGIKLRQLRVSSKTPGKMETTDMSLIDSTVKNVFAEQNVAILEKFAERLKKYVESQMAGYSCKTVRVLDFLKKSLNTRKSISVY